MSPATLWVVPGSLLCGARCEFGCQFVNAVIDDVKFQSPLTRRSASARHETTVTQRVPKITSSVLSSVGIAGFRQAFRHGRSEASPAGTDGIAYHGLPRVATEFSAEFFSPTRLIGCAPRARIVPAGRVWVGVSAATASPNGVT